MPENDTMTAVFLNESKQGNARNFTSEDFLLQSVICRTMILTGEENCPTKQFAINFNRSYLFVELKSLVGPPLRNISCHPGGTLFFREGGMCQGKGVSFTCYPHLVD